MGRQAKVASKRGVAIVETACSSIEPFYLVTSRLWGIILPPLVWFWYVHWKHPHPSGLARMGSRLLLAVACIFSAAGVVNYFAMMLRLRGEMSIAALLEQEWEALLAISLWRSGLVMLIGLAASLVVTSPVIVFGWTSDSDLFTRREARDRRTAPLPPE